MTHSSHAFPGAQDQKTLADHGISAEEARRQLEFFENPTGPRNLLRPCTQGDGILLIEDMWQASFVENFKHASRTGRVTKFVPASGAASRMFVSIPEETERLKAELPRFAFAKALAQAAQHMDLGDALLSSRGLNFASLPKGLIPFHTYEGTSRTPFEEHLVEAALYTSDKDGVCRIHFTVSREHESWFRELFRSKCAFLENDLRVTFDLSFGHQSPATDTVAGDPCGGPFRTEAGDLVFRPGGHGALLANLSELAGDIVVIKNIDNVVPDPQKSDTIHWKHVLIGLLVELQQKSHHSIQALEETPEDSQALEIARTLLETLRGTSESADTAETLIHLLNRPLRVCGMVQNQGEPGGGPFWVQGPRGASKQIVESSEVDFTHPEQKQIWESSTHFNPVDLVVALRDPRGKPYNLQKFTDPEAVYISKKSHQGKDLLALEWPGLWNGAMAQWNTVFVEVPLTTFAPVKTVFDLLRPQHQPPPTPAT